MRVFKTTDGLKVYAVSGTYVVTMGFHLPKQSCRGLRGFAIHRVDHDTGDASYLTGVKTFAETDPGFPTPAHYPTNEQPIQSFQWADYTAEPGHSYTYTVSALKGSPAALEVAYGTAIKISTEDPEGGDHDVYFNRGTAASQAYAERFGERRPEQVPNNQAFKWLSRGLYEAMSAYVQSSKRGEGLRVAAYEFQYPGFLELLAAAKRRGVDVRVVYDHRDDPPTTKNVEAVDAAGIGEFCKPRKSNKSYISHNKFIVKLKKGKAVSVWTGGTNFSKGGIFGHSNVGHLLEDEKIAEKFLDYWKLLNDDPDAKELRVQVEALTPLPKGKPKKGTTAIFSPRTGMEALNWYAELAGEAQEGLMMTFAFGMNALWRDVYATNPAPFRLALLENITRPMKDGPEKDAEIAKVQELRNIKEVVVAVGSFIETNEFDGWMAERLSRLNHNVKFVHNKFMLIDPLSDDPIVIAGSANFSEPSTNENDENMLVVRGNKRVADIYLGEFMRLYTHHAFRESLKWRKPDQPPKPLETGDWWRDYFGDTPRSIRRQFFARVSS